MVSDELKPGHEQQKINPTALVVLSGMIKKHLYVDRDVSMRGDYSTRFAEWDDQFNSYLDQPLRGDIHKHSYLLT